MPGPGGVLRGDGNYYHSQARDWERYAMVKARPICGDPDEVEALMSMLRAFVYRRYIDFGVIESIRSMKRMIERELHKKGMDANIKLGQGGIREIEFIGQAFQLVRGGREPELQERPIQVVLRGWRTRHPAGLCRARTARRLPLPAPDREPHPGLEGRAEPPACRRPGRRRTVSPRAWVSADWDDFEQTCAGTGAGSTNTSGRCSRHRRSSRSVVDSAMAVVWQGGASTMHGRAGGTGRGRLR
jgi:hypothetical protein